MLFLSHHPAPPLSHFVDSFWSLSDAPPRRSERILPSGTLELVINLHEDEFRIYDPVQTDRFRRFPGAIVSGAVWRKLHHRHARTRLDHRRPFQAGRRASLPGRSTGRAGRYARGTRGAVGPARDRASRTAVRRNDLCLALPNPRRRTALPAAPPPVQATRCCPGRSRLPRAGQGEHRQPCRPRPTEPPPVDRGFRRRSRHDAEAVRAGGTIPARGGACATDPVTRLAQQT